MFTAFAMFTLFVLCVLAVAGAEFAGTGWPDLSAVPSPWWTAWCPALVGIPLIWLLVASRGHAAELDQRTRGTLVGHPVARELSRLCLCLAGFLVGAVVLGRAFEMFDDELLILGTPVSRIVFLLIVPAVLLDRVGATLEHAGGSMLRLAVRVREPWRWWGLGPVTVCLGVLLAHQWDALVPLRVDFPLVVLGLLVAVVIPEEVFFRGMVQTRLEAILGRLPAIALTALLFAASYAALGSYVDFLRADVQRVSGDYVLATATYGVTGLLYGYLWARYRNIWLNIVLRTGVLAFLLGPVIVLVS